MVDPSIGSAAVVCEEGGENRGSAVSSSIEGLEARESGDVEERGDLALHLRLRRTWLASETNSVQSRTGSGLSS